MSEKVGSVDVLGPALDAFCRRIGGGDAVDLVALKSCSIAPLSSIDRCVVTGSIVSACISASARRSCTSARSSQARSSFPTATALEALRAAAFASDMVRVTAVIAAPMSFDEKTNSSSCRSDLIDAVSGAVAGAVLERAGDDCGALRPRGR